MRQLPGQHTLHSAKLNSRKEVLYRHMTVSTGGALWLC